MLEMADISGLVICSLKRSNLCAHFFTGTTRFNLSQIIKSFFIFLQTLGVILWGLSKESGLQCQINNFTNETNIFWAVNYYVVSGHQNLQRHTWLVVLKRSFQTCRCLVSQKMRLEVFCVNAKTPHSLWADFQQATLQIPWLQSRGEEKKIQKEVKKWRNKRWEYWFHGRMANTELLIFPTKRLDSVHRLIQILSINASPTLPSLASYLALCACWPCLKHINVPFLCQKSQDASRSSHTDQKFSLPRSFQCLAMPWTGQAANLSSTLENFLSRHKRSWRLGR